jgi:C-terminal processing protease CtpA/Prc
MCYILKEKKEIMKKTLLLFLGLILFIVSCSDKDDDFVPEVKPLADIVVQDFMWKAMNFYYFWQQDVPNLADTKFKTNDEYRTFLASVEEPGDFFNTKLRFGDDRFSFFSENYKELVNNFAGISKSSGMEFGLVNSASRGLFGVVRYIIPNSDASTKNITRGEVFNGVNGQTLTIENYEQLLFGTNDSYTLNMANVTSNTISRNGKEVSLTKREGLSENPVHLAKVVEVSGKKIGYLMYNGFTSKYDTNLNDAFGQFKTESVTDLVLDLRYNPGGSVNSARLLSSMIYGTKTTELFLRQRWNNKLQSQSSREDIEDYFASTLQNGTAINTLNLTRVYVLVSRSSASASELVINGLRPYLNVVLIGSTTRGKNEFSITMVDDPARSGAPFIYSEAREGNINSKNNWAIQPLVGRNENAAGFSDYTAGFTPEIILSEDAINYGILGNVNEPLFARAIQAITGVSGKRDFTVEVPTDVFTSSKMFTPLKDNMYLDKEISINF